ncbi:hypothetical protein OOZ15_18365 [Galbibacter sp. EGI 63066]|uniref:hypothetical protein n=1 Tax=Galbibacter sp. EGI 63066 TaxID=2993559 RepID=UPI002248EC3B|nr:hypothetical protein [Galbibacter sp. EGI 63066]MCX2681922.1 hypothetical protein [Galbibacter sp. EGI 63066]
MTTSIKIKKWSLSIVFLIVSLQGFSQFVVFEITWINTDRTLLQILGQKSAVNSAMLVQQTLIHQGLKDIRRSKQEIRKKEFEINRHDKSLAVPLGLNLTINNLLMGTPIVAPSSFPFYITAEKSEYLTRELAINNSIAGLISSVRNTNIRNANTQELYSLNQKLLAKLKKTNRHAYKDASFIILASLLANVATMPADDLSTILSLGL